MAKHPFADRARQVLEEQGLKFDDNGNVVVGQAVSNPTVPVQTTQIPPQNAEQQTPPPDENTSTKENDQGVNGVDLLTLQREELERMRGELAQLNAEKEQWSQTSQVKTERELALEAELNDLRTQLAQKEDAQSVDEVRAIFEASGFNSDTLEDEVIVEIRDKLLKPVVGKMDKLEATVKAFENRVNDKLRDPTPEERLEAVKTTTLNKVKEQYPDFDTIFNSDKFAQFLQKQDPNMPTGTIGGAMQIAYEGGNHQFMVSKIKEFLEGDKAPNLANVADVGATNGVGNTVTQPEQTGFTYSNEEARKMLDARRMRQITGQEYSEYVAKRDEFLRSKQI